MKKYDFLTKISKNCGFSVKANQDMKAYTSQFFHLKKKSLNLLSRIVGII